MKTEVSEIDNVTVTEVLLHQNVDIISLAPLVCQLKQYYQW